VWRDNDFLLPRKLLKSRRRWLSVSPLGEPSESGGSALWLLALYGLPVVPRCGRVIMQAYHVWGMDNAGILLPQRTGSGRASASGTTRKWACVPAGSDDRQH